MIRTLLAAAAALTLVTGPLKAEPLKPPAVAFVDIDQLSAQSKATQSLGRQVSAEIEAFRAQIAFKYEALQEELRMLRVDSATMTAQQRVDRQTALQESVASIQNEEAEGIARIEARGAAAFEGLQGGFSEVIELVAESLELDVVLQAPAYQQLVADNLIAPGAEDVTDLVLVFLDSRYPDVALPPAEDTP